MCGGSCCFWLCEYLNLPQSMLDNAFDAIDHMATLISFGYQTKIKMSAESARIQSMFALSPHNEFDRSLKISEGRDQKFEKSFYELNSLLPPPSYPTLLLPCSLQAIKNHKLLRPIESRSGKPHQPTSFSSEIFSATILLIFNLTEKVYPDHFILSYMKTPKNSLKFTSFSLIPCQLS